MLFIIFTVYTISEFDILLLTFDKSYLYNLLPSSCSKSLGV